MGFRTDALAFLDVSYINTFFFSIFSLCSCSTCNRAPSKRLCCARRIFRDAKPKIVMISNPWIEIIGYQGTLGNKDMSYTWWQAMTSNVYLYTYVGIPPSGSLMFTYGLSTLSNVNYSWYHSCPWHLGLDNLLSWPETLLPSLLFDHLSLISGLLTLFSRLFQHLFCFGCAWCDPPLPGLSGKSDRNTFPFGIYTWTSKTTLESQLNPLGLLPHPKRLSLGANG